MTKRKERTGTLPGIEIPGHDEELTTLALDVVSVKEDAARKKKEVDDALVALLEKMKEKKVSKYHDADAKVRVEVAKSRETVKVLKDKPRKASRGMVSRGGRL
jgi:hypothetical protein